MDTPNPLTVSRRQFGVVAGTAIASLALRGPSYLSALQDSEGRISARPHAGVKTTIKGTQTLGLDTGRDGVVQIPKSAGTDPLPLIVMCHGAGSEGRVMLRRHGEAAEEAGIVMLAPDSRGPTWDAISGSFTQDVHYINRALAWVFDRVNVDPKRIALGGFSDGATYALSLGLINGDFFPKVAAFSPGFVVAGTPHGKPKFFVSHGRSDEILSIDRCSRVIVPALQKRGYDVAYHEFDGPHVAPPNMVHDAFHWVTGTP